MASDRADVSFPSSQQELEQALLSLLLEDKAPYPWNPANEATEAFFAAAEDEWVAGQSSEELDAINAQSYAFFDRLSQAWDTSSAQPSDALQAQLVSHFGDRIPHSFLNRIAQQAQTLLNTQQPLADQLVQCVQDLLSGWNTDDLIVLARPYAYAMRGNDADALEAALRSVRYAAWTELSGVEQARLSLAIARYTLTQASSEKTR